MKQIFFIILIIISIFNSNGQIKCGTDEYNKKMELSQLSLYLEKQVIEQGIYIASKNNESIYSRISDSIKCLPFKGKFIIPVVVHVIHLGEDIGTGTNVSYEHIVNGINIANENFRNVNGKGIDMEIQFELAVRDPNFNPSTGINRVDGNIFPGYKTYGAFVFEGVGISFSEIMDQVGWPPKDYFNIYVMKLQDRAGFGGWNGIGISPNWLMSNYISYLITHEIGHGMGLGHTFAGDENGCPPNLNCLLQGDGVCDTPPHKRGDCITTTCDSSSNLDNAIKNYMSYCENDIVPPDRFTPGQKERARNFITSFLPSWITSYAKVPEAIPLEVGLVEILNDFTYPVEPTNFIPIVKIRNISSELVSNLKIDIIVDGELVKTTEINEIIPKNKTTIYQLDTINFEKTGVKNLSIFISQINGNNTDFQPLNNQICKSFMVRNIPINNFCINVEEETFNTILPQTDAFCNPKLVSVNGCENIGSKSLKLNFYDSRFLYVNNTFYLPTFNLDSVYTAYLSYDYSYIKGGSKSDMIIQFYCLDENRKYNFIQFKSNNSLITNPTLDTINPWIPTSCDHWKTDSLNITTFRGKNNLTLGINYFINTRDRVVQNLYFDNFCIHKKYKIFISQNIKEGGTINITKPDGVYEEDSIANVSAVSNYCYKFKYWMENSEIVSQNANYSFKVSRNRNLIAIFEIDTINIELISNLNDDNIILFKSSNSCDSILYVGCKLENCYKFLYWSENGEIVSYDSLYFFAKTKNRSLVANIKKITPSLTLVCDPAGAGDLTGGGIFLKCDTIVNVSQNPKYGYTFSHWASKLNPLTIYYETTLSYNVKDNDTLIAFYKPNLYDVSFIYRISGHDSLIATFTKEYNSNFEFTADSIIKECFGFRNWQLDSIIIEFNTLLNILVDKNKTYISNYEKNEYDLLLTTNINDAGVLFGAGQYPCGSLINIIAQPDSCYKFLHWAEKDIILSDNGNLSIELKSDRNISAIFSLKEYEISLKPSPEYGGMVFNDGYFGCDSLIIVTAEPNTNYKFLNWTENGSIVSTEANYKFKVNVDRILYANFELSNGLENPNLKPKVMIYPNPVSEYLNVVIDSDIQTQYTLEITDLVGRVHAIKRFFNNDKNVSMKYDFKNFAKGFYILKIFNTNELIHFKITIQ